jgi:hypothetical protein
MREYIDKKNIVNSFTPNSNFKTLFKIKFSKLEILHLSIATILVIAVGVSFSATILVTTVGVSFSGVRNVSWQFLLIFASAFLVHELAHKLLAQFYGSWAEFRANLYGLIVTAISVLLPFKFIAPGAVMID